MSLINNLKYKCDNCSNEDKIGSLTVAYRCSSCRLINCLMCNKTHDNACDIFHKNDKFVSKVTAGSIKSTTVPSSNKLKRGASNIQLLDVSKNLLSVSSTDNLESVPKKPKKMERRFTIAADSIESIDKADQNETQTELKCNICESFFKTKGTLARHMKSNKHAAKVKSLKEAQPGTSTSLPAIKLDRFSSAETVVVDSGI